MKTCPKGHMYPDSLSHCPVCDKSGTLNTRYHKPVYEEPPPNIKSIHSGPTNSRPNYDRRTAGEPLLSTDDCPTTTGSDARTILLGAALTGVEAGLGGWLIEINDHDNLLKSYELFLHKKNRIGRGRENNIVLPAKYQSISRNHCMIEYKAPYFIIHDNNSANGTKVGDQLISSRELDDMSLILLGDQKYRIKYVKEPGK